MLESHLEPEMETEMTQRSHRNLRLIWVAVKELKSCDFVHVRTLETPV